MDSEKFQKVMEYADKHLMLGEEASLDEMVGRLARMPALWQQFSRTGFDIANELSDLLIQKDSLRGELMIDLKTNPGKSSLPMYQVSLKTKEDYENQLHAYKQWNELMKAIAVVEAQANHMKTILEGVRQFGYTLKDLIAIKKLQAGIMA